MNYVFQAILLVFALGCALMVEAYWSSLHSEKSVAHALFKSIATGSGFVIYAGIDYLMIVPGMNYVMA